MNETFNEIADNTKSRGQISGESLRKVLKKLTSGNAEEFKKARGINASDKSLYEVLDMLAEDWDQNKSK